MGARIFRFSLLVLAAAFFEHAIILLYLFNRGGAPAWAVYLHHETYYDFALHCVMAFAAMAMWSESQIDRLRDLTGELDHLRRERKHTMDLDRLTGLLNQAALSQRVEEPAGFEGVVVVCDMDNFKDINDRYGHLVGDEILRNIGNLLQSSIRHEDEAFRWGGDEFVILFRNQRTDVAVRRMADIESRLRDFRVRGLGILPIRFSWGTADTAGRPLRDALDEADRNMYIAQAVARRRRARRASALRHGERIDGRAGPGGPAQTGRSVLHGAHVEHDAVPGDRRRVVREAVKEQAQRLGAGGSGHGDAHVDLPHAGEARRKAGERDEVDVAVGVAPLFIALQGNLIGIVSADEHAQASL